MTARATLSLAQRFWAHVAIGERHECWPWIDCEPDTYPYFRAGTKSYHASRIAFMLETGRWAEYLRHSCDNPPCVNPAHLIESTHAENVADMVAKGRNRPHGKDQSVRRCGDCQLCCVLLPVGAVAKGAGQRCQHQRHRKGCAVYASLMHVSPECRLWSCRWLMRDAGDTRRPDHAHFVIDPMPDFITVNDEVQGKINVQVVQVWCDPKYPDAHRDPALRAYLEKRGLACLVRYDNERAIVLMPPAMMVNHEWLERSTGLNQAKTHTFAEVVSALSQ